MTYFSLCRFDRVQLSLFPKSHPRSVWSWHLTTSNQLIQQQPEIRRNEWKCSLKDEGETREKCEPSVYPRCSEVALCERIIRKHKLLLSNKCFHTVRLNVNQLKKRSCSGWTELRMMKMDWSSKVDPPVLPFRNVCAVLQVTCQNNSTVVPTLFTFICIQIAENVYHPGQLILWTPQHQNSSNVFPVITFFYSATEQTPLALLLISPWNMGCCKRI